MLLLDHRRGAEVWLRWSAVGQHFTLFSAAGGIEVNYLGCADTMVEARLFAAGWLAAETC